jgi:DNA-binding transcriptional MerR regulator
MEKSPEAFRTISEVADFLETPAHVLRFWESRFPQIRPVKRAGGRRYYRPSDVALLAGIKKLLHDDGMTIRGVQKILREHGIRHVAAIGNGEDPWLVTDVPADATPPADLPMQDRFSRSQTPEVMQTAQIIPLDLALGRAENTPTAETDLPWPAGADVAPVSQAPDAPWPVDPNDVGTDGEAASQPDLFADQPAQDSSEVAVAEPTEAAPEAGALLQVDGTQDPEPEEPTLAKEAAPADATVEPDVAGGGVATTETGDGTTESDRAASTPAEAAEATSDVAAGTETEVTAAQPDPATETEITVAALLRRTDPASVAEVQAELRSIRDRLILLRGRVADAARRRAK